MIRDQDLLPSRSRSKMAVLPSEAMVAARNWCDSGKYHCEEFVKE